MKNQKTTFVIFTKHRSVRATLHSRASLLVPPHTFSKKNTTHIFQKGATTLLAVVCLAAQSLEEQFLETERTDAAAQLPEAESHTARLDQHLGGPLSVSCKVIFRVRRRGSDQCIHCRKGACRCVSPRQKVNSLVPESGWSLLETLRGALLAKGLELLSIASESADQSRWSEGFLSSPVPAASEAVWNRGSSHCLGADRGNSAKNVRGSKGIRKRILQTSSRKFDAWWSTFLKKRSPSQPHISKDIVNSTGEHWRAWELEVSSNVRSCVFHDISLTLRTSACSLTTF